MNNKIQSHKYKTVFIKRQSLEMIVHYIRCINCLFYLKTCFMDSDLYILQRERECIRLHVETDRYLTI
jgi:hypothetical protein